MEVARSRLCGDMTSPSTKAFETGRLASPGGHGEGIPPRRPALAHRLPLSADQEAGGKDQLGKEADLSAVDRLKPDVVFVAAGGVPTLPDIPGIRRSNAVSGAELHKKVKFFSRFLGPYTLRRLSKLYMPIGKRVVIIGGGLMVGLGEFLTKRGRIVTIVEKADKFGDGMIEVYRSHLMYWFEKKGVNLIGGVKEYVEITDDGLTIVDREGKRRTIQADTFVPALPLTPNMTLFQDLSRKVPEVYAIGDCKEPGLIADQ